MTATITIPWDKGARTFDRGRLATAVLLFMDRLDVPDTFAALLAEGIERREAVELAVAARICHERNIEP